MQRTLSILILISYIFSVSQATASNALGAATIIKVTHTHTEADHHHDHEDSDESDHHENDDHSGNESHQSSTAHSHEIVLPSVGFYTADEASSFLCFELVNEGFPEAIDSLPPRDLNLDSIFRPPIA